MKGNLIIAQSGGPTAVINSSVASIVEEALKHEEIKGIYGAIHGILGVLEERLVDLRKESRRNILGLRSTPCSALGSCRYKVSEKDLERIFEVIRAHKIGYFFVIGGNDSMDTAARIDKYARSVGYELRVIGIPKTVDNDLVLTDHCPGYPSVARWIATGARDASRDTRSIHISDRVKVIEIMGRDSGWITAASVLTKESEEDGPHLIYLPEVAFSRKKFLADVKKVCKEVGYCIVAVCEGIKDKKGKALVESKSKLDMDGFGHAQRGGVGEYLCWLVADKLGIKARCDKPGTIQRVSMALASKVDLKEAYQVGRVAVRAALKNQTGKMIALKRLSNNPYQISYQLVGLEKVANEKKFLPRDFINKQGNFVTKKFINWVRPLVGPLPEYVNLKKVPVKKLLKTYEV